LGKELDPTCLRQGLLAIDAWVEFTISESKDTSSEEIATIFPRLLWARVTPPNLFGGMMHSFYKV
jgi:hypothetical protein